MIPSTPISRRRSSTSRSLGGDNRTTTTSPFSSRPIADLFPNSTVLFGDLVGFTAWSSVRQPSQVFILLETLYYRFDQTAKKFGVFKVETIGDCYGRSDSHFFLSLVVNKTIYAAEWTLGLQSKLDLTDTYLYCFFVFPPPFP
jgi:class 3 adenylate cyclase